MQTCRQYESEISTQNILLRFEFVEAVLLKIKTFWNFKGCRLVKRHF
jgi:hypothetical protein